MHGFGQLLVVLICLENIYTFRKAQRTNWRHHSRRINDETQQSTLIPPQNNSIQIQKKRDDFFKSFFDPTHKDKVIRAWLNQHGNRFKSVPRNSTKPRKRFPGTPSTENINIRKVVGNNSSKTVRMSRKQLRFYQSGISGKIADGEIISSEQDMHTNRKIPLIAYPRGLTTIPTFNCAIVKRQEDSDIPICSGALLTKHVVLTVGSGCVLVDQYLFSPDDLVVMFVTYDTKNREIVNYENQVVDVLLNDDCCRPEEYVPEVDLALLYLQDAVAFDDFIRPVKLPKFTSSVKYPHTSGYWDLSNYRVFDLAVDYTDAIWFIKTPYVSNHLCDMVISKDLFAKSLMTCAGYYHKGEESCMYDTGSPLSYKGQLIGLMLYKQACGFPHTAALFVNVGINANWIKKKVKEITNYNSNPDQQVL